MTSSTTGSLNRPRGDDLRGSSSSAGQRRVLLAKPRGYCAGVDRAVQAVEIALDRYGAPIYVRKQIVHNVHVVKTLEERGAIFVEETEEVPEGSIVVFSAHGVPPRSMTRRPAGAADDRRDLPAGDQGPRKEAVRFAADDYDILLIGHEGHEEVVGTTGEAPEHIHLVDGPGDVAKVKVRDESKVAWLSQTTLSVDETIATVDKTARALPRCWPTRRRTTSATPPRTGRWR
jgi:Penicillin tolerance protein